MILCSSLSTWSDWKHAPGCFRKCELDMWNSIIGSTHKDHLCLEMCLQQNFYTQDPCEGHLRCFPWFIVVSMNFCEPTTDFFFFFLVVRRTWMKQKYLCDGSLNSHGMNPGDRGIPSVLQAGGCKSDTIFHKSPGTLVNTSLYFWLVSLQWGQKWRRERAKKQGKEVCSVCGRRRAEAAALWRRLKIAAAVSTWIVEEGT